MQRSEGGLPEALTRLTTTEVWLVRAMIPTMAMVLIAGGTFGTVSLIEFARSEGGASPQDSQPGEPDEGPGSATGGAPADGDVVLADLAVDHGPPDYAAILSRRYPGAQWSLDGDRYEGLVWLDASPKPTQVELDALWPEVAEELARERAARDAEERLAARAREQELQERRDDPAVQATLDGLDPRRIWGGTPDYAAILTRRFPGAQWSLDGNDPLRLQWSGPGSAPTKAQLDAMWADVAREMALELDPEELARWAGTGEQVYVDGVLRPKGWVGGANDPQPNPVATPRDVQYLPQIPHTNNGSPVGTIGILKDPTGAQNFEQKYGLQLHELGALIAEAHGYFGGSHGLGLSLNGDRELMWYSDQVDPAIVAQVLADLGAVEPSPPPAAPAQPDPQPDAQPDPQPDAQPDPSEDDAAQD